jgi:hypothetical protein
MNKTLIRVPRPAPGRPKAGAGPLGGRALYSATGG